MQVRPGRLTARLLDAAAVAGVWAFVSFGSTAQRWTGLDTPDSEFYATLGLFGHEVTDRAPYPVYYWTRFGTILPVRALTEAFGPWAGYHVFWLLLVAAIVVSTFVMTRRFTTRFVASLLSALVALSTVVLGMLGNPYVSGTAMAATLVLIAAVVFTLPRPGSPEEDRAASRVVAPLVAGLALGWLVMTNPYAAMLATSVWAVATVVVALQWRSGRLLYLVRAVALGALGAAASFLTLLALGRLAFRGMDWLETNLYWSRALNSADYVTDLWSFRRDVVFVVPVVALVIVVALALIRPSDRVLRVAAVLPPAAAGFGFGFLLLSPSNTLEIPHYQALQWTPALAAIALAVAAVVGTRAAPWWVVVAGAVVVVAAIAAGHWDGTMDLLVGWVVGAVLAIGFVGACAMAWPRIDAGSARALLGVVLATGVLFSGFQLLQNAHRPLTFSAESPYANAFTPNDVFATLDSAQRAQQWLIGSTTPADKVMVWVDADWSVDETLLPMAAFQLWGANQITSLPSLYGPELDHARDLKPTVIAMYGRTKEAIWRFWGALPTEVRRTDPQCTSYPWPDPNVPTAYVCLTHLTWR